MIRFGIKYSYKLLLKLIHQNQLTIAYKIYNIIVTMASKVTTDENEKGQKKEE